jgi:hypothetical protein
MWRKRVLYGYCENICKFFRFFAQVIFSCVETQDTRKRLMDFVSILAIDRKKVIFL